MKNFNLSEVLQYGVDLATAYWPQSRPDSSKLAHTQLVAHRGSFDNFNTFENTLPAFQSCLENKIWGIELDLRWTQDLQPIILHDSDCGRVYGRPNIEPSRYTLSMLRQHAPFIPTLQEVVDLCGLQTHLMIEIKESLSDPDNLKVQRLAKILQCLRPEVDYHFMSFSIEHLKRVEFAPPHSLLGIAEWNLNEMSQQILNENLGGITGHYLLAKQRMIERHHQAGQKVGLGFIQSPNSLFREINRGVDWIFTDRPLFLKKLINESSNSSH